MRGLVRGALLVALLAAVRAGLQAEDRKTTGPAAAKTGKAVNIMWRFDGLSEHPSPHRMAERQEHSLEDPR